MTSASIRFVNSNEPPLFVQVDPWAGLYRLEKGEKIEISAESETSAPEFQLEEYKDQRIVTILHSDDYFVTRNDGPRIHMSECPTDCGW